MTRLSSSRITSDTLHPRSAAAAFTADWRDAAACAGAETDVFFPHPKSGSDYREALAFCHRCPVREACLTDALLMERNNSDRHGMRGGLTPEQRARLVKHR